MHHVHTQAAPAENDHLVFKKSSFDVSTSNAIDLINGHYHKNIKQFSTLIVIRNDS